MKLCYFCQISIDHGCLCAKCGDELNKEQINYVCSQKN